MHQFGLRSYARKHNMSIKKIHFSHQKKQFAEKQDFKGQSLCFNHRISFDTKHLMPSGLMVTGPLQECPLDYCEWTITRSSPMYYKWK